MSDNDTVCFQIRIDPEVRPMLKKISKWQGGPDYRVLAGQILHEVASKRLEKIINSKVPKPSIKLRAKIFKRDSHKCAYCGGIADSIDHIIPRVAKGSSNRLKNLTTACRSCNSIANARVFENFEEKKKYILEVIANNVRIRQYNDGIGKTLGL